MRRVKLEGEHFQLESPEHRSPRSVQSFESEEAVPCRHPGSVKSHQTVKLFEGDAHRPLQGEKTAAGKAFDCFKNKSINLDQVTFINRTARETVPAGSPTAGRHGR